MGFRGSMFVGLVGLCSWSCGGAAPAARAPSDPARAGAGEGESSAQSAPAAGEVPAPPGLIGSLRVANPTETWKRAFRLAGREATPLGFAGPSLFASSLFNAPPQILNLETPFDVGFAVSKPREAVDLKNESHFAISAAVHRGEEARDVLGRLFTLSPDANGGLRFELENRSRTGEVSKRYCALTPSLVPSSPRLICGDSNDGLDLLAPYLARTLARTTPKEDIRMDFSFEATHHAVETERDRALAELRQTSPESWATRAGEEFAMKHGFDFLVELSTFSLGASFEPSGLDLALTLGFARGESFFSKLLLGRPERSAPAPEAFWALPIESSLAFFTHGADSADLEPLRSSLFTVISRSLEDDAFEEPRRVRFIELARQVVLTGGPLVFAAGTDREKAEASATWFVAAVEEPPSRWIETLKGFVALDSDATALKPAKGKGKGKAKDDKNVPVVRERCEHHALRISRLDPALELPRDSLRVEMLTVPQKCAERTGEIPGPSVTQIFVAPAGGGKRTWIAVGERPAALARVLRTAVGPAPDRALRGREGLDELRDQSMSHGGFLTLGGGLRLAGELPAPTGGGSETLEPPICVTFSPEAHGEEKNLAIKARAPKAAVRMLLDLLESS